MEEQEGAMENSSNTLYYILGAVVLVVVIGVGYLLRPKGPAAPGQQATNVPAAPTPTPGPISKLACDSVYFNPVIGFEKYYLSAEGGDLPGPAKVDCTFEVLVNDKVVATKKISSDLTPKPERNGSVFKCTTEGMELKADTPTIVNVELKDDKNYEATCSGTFIFPRP